MTPDPAVVSEREQKILGIIETARGKRAKFRDSRINMSHGAGGKATQSLIEGLLAPAFASETLDEMADAGALQIDGAELALTTDSSVPRAWVLNWVKEIEMDLSSLLSEPVAIPPWMAA